MYHQVSPDSTAAVRCPPASAAALLVGVLLSGTAALAQPTPTPGAAPKPNWGAIREKALSSIDRSTVQKWVTSQIDQIFSAQEPATPGAAFYKEVTDQAHAPGTAAAFKDALGQIVIEAFTARYRHAANGDDKPNPLAPALVLMTLRDMGAGAAALPAFQAAIADQAPAVRCEGIMGINSLRAALPPAVRTSLIEPIRKAALTETSPAVLGRLYDFLRFVGDNPAQGQDLQIAQALVNILDARLTRVEKESEWPAVADAETINWLAAKSRNPGLNNDQARKDIIRVTARLLADAAYACANLKPPDEIKLDLQRIAFLTEDPADNNRPVLGLADLYKAKVPNGALPSPTVTETMNLDGADQKAKISAAIAKWIGSDQTKGLLNDPFGLPIGLNIQRPAPATATAPAS